MNIPFIDTQGNWGNITGDGAAAARYIEGKLSAFTSKYILGGIEKGIVDFSPNYDNSRKEPNELPVKFNQLLVNGAIGIAAGFAVNIPSHNIIEVCSATLAYINEKILKEQPFPLSSIMKYIKGPDYPTGGIVSGQDLKKIYETGEGKIYIRAKISYNTNNNTLVISEIPYGTFTDDITISIKEAVESKRISSITKIVDESKDLPRIILKLKSDADPKTVINQLYQYSKCQVTRPVQFLGVQDQTLIQFNLLKSIANFVKFRYSCLKKELVKDLSTYEESFEIQSGFLKAVSIIDDIIKVIKKCENEKAVLVALQKTFGFSPLQAQKIADLKLSRLSKISINEIKDALKELTAKIDYLKTILADKKEIVKLIAAEQEDLISYAKKHNYQRKTSISEFKTVKQENIKSLYPNHDFYIVLTKNGYIKKFTKSAFEVQNRNGKGKSVGKLKQGDYVLNIQPCQNHDKIFVFGKKGLVYPLDVYKIDESDYLNLGRHASSYLKLKDNEEIVSLVFCKDEDVKEPKDKSFIFLTSKGLIKKTRLSEFSNIYETGIIAIKLKDKDNLVEAELYTPSSLNSEENPDTVLLFTKSCKVLRFPLSDEELSATLRPTYGRIGIKLKEKDSALGFLIKYANDDYTHVLVVTEAGYGKKTPIELIIDENGEMVASDKGYPIKKIGQMGYFTMNVQKRSPVLVGHLLVKENTLFNILTKTKVIQLSTSELRSLDRLTMGVKLIKLDKSDSVYAMNAVD
jgi:DNA gyrase subunit A